MKDLQWEDRNMWIHILMNLSWGKIFVMLLPLGIGGIMFSGCQSIQTSSLLSCHPSICLSIHPANPDRFYVCLSVPIFSCDQAALQMVFSVCLSVCLSVCPSVRLSHLFDYVPIIVSSWNFQELLPVTEVTSMQKVKVKGQGHRGHNPTLPFPDCNSNLNWRMMMKWYI